MCTKILRSRPTFRKPQRNVMPRVTAAVLCSVLLASSTSTAAQARGSAGWKRGAVCYEIFVRSFYDSDGDGIGDLKGLTQKLDYINDGNPHSRRDLGARCIWLMPIDASPSYHGYDVKNYYRVNPEYGTNDDFKRLVAAAHKRGIKVLVDLVLNHASNEHPYFKEALRDTASAHRSWFRFSATNPNVKGPWGEEVWHRSPVRDEYYYGVFTAQMPDLNYENPAVRQEAKNVARFWLKDMGADGFRLDAIPYLVESGDSLAHTAATHAVLRDWAAYVRRIAPNAYTIGEVWDSIGAQLPYYPDQLDALFSFDVSNAILDAVRTGSAKKLLAPVLRLQRELPADRWSPFLRNHDQTRTLTALGGDVARAKTAATLLLTLPGLPFVYYGEEIGMAGDKPDERLRTPMQWTPGRAAGFTRGLAWEPLQPDSLIANVRVEAADHTSLLNLYRRLIHIRATNAALAGGTLEPVDASNDGVAAYLRRDGDRAVLVVANLRSTSLSDVSFSSAAGSVPAGTYRPTQLLDGPTVARLRIGHDGRIVDYVPVRTLAPMTSYLLELRLTRR